MVLKKYKTELLYISAVLTVGLILFFYPSILSFDRNIDDDELIIEEPNLAWGIPVDSMKIDTFAVQRNQNLSDILIKSGFSPASIFEIVNKAQDIFDVRKIRSGNNYFILQRENSDIPEYFVYEENAVNYVVFALNDSMNVYRGEKPIVTKYTVTEGVIESSLWNALAGQGINPTLAVEMSDVFAWTIDFFGIQKGDNFRVLYEEKYVDDQLIGFGKIYAAQMNHMGKTQNAIWFDNENQQGYFDETGNSLKKAFLKAPLKFSRISSHFSNARKHPILKITRPHHGVDYAAPAGTPVQTIGDGVVVKKAYQASGGGNYLTIKHNSVYSTTYMHLKGFAPGIVAGARVSQGQVIGYVGSTGLSSGPHLDFRVFKNGSPIDPLKVEAPPVEPISDSNKMVFGQVRDSLLNILQTKQVPQIEQPVSPEDVKPAPAVAQLGNRFKRK
jgi:murein DD-endopeptidase MepM/ murein hydrolase activator NlpD